MADNLTVMEVERDLIAFRKTGGLIHPGKTYTEFKSAQARRRRAVKQGVAVLCVVALCVALWIF